MPPLFIAIAPTVRFDDELFWVMRLTFDPTPPLINTLPDPLPEFVIVPVLLTGEDNVIACVPLALSVRFPVPVLPTVPDTVKVFPVPLLPIVLSLARVTAPA